MGRRGENDRRPARVAAGLAAAAGVLAGASALGAAELAAGAIGRAVSPALVVGGAAVDRTPRFLKEFAIRTFGERDKVVLLAGVFTVIALLAALIGLIGLRHWRASQVGVALLGIVAAAAAANRPDARPYDVVPSLVAAAVGVVALTALLLRVAAPAATTDATADGPRAPVPRPARRQALVFGGAAALAGASGVGGRLLQQRRSDVDASRRALRLPQPAEPAATLPAGAQLDVPGLQPFFTSSPSFYRVDTALSVPRLTTREWRLRLHGMVDHEIELTFEALLKRRIVERDITLTCVSNEVGGNLLGTARWLGVALAPLLREAGVRPGATQLVSRSVDGMTIGTPVSAVLDGRDAMLAIAMNGEPLLPEHGFPVRMLVPGLYGYVSATKWLTELELSTFEAFDAYWVRRGWAEQAAIKTSSRIDTPKPLARIAPGRVPVAGVAWAQQRGISRVEVRVDGEPWQEARLSEQANDDLWRQWVWEWDARPGSHTLQVRATDGQGNLQVQERRPPFPDGSSGWQAVLVTVAT